MDNAVTKNSEEDTFTVAGFLFKTILWIIPAFFFWYIAAAIFCFPAIFLSDLIIPYLLPSILEGVEQQSYLADIVTELDIKDNSGQTGQLVFSINTLKYAYGFPLLFAMTVATNQSIYKKLDTLTYGFIIIALAQTWSICFEVLSTLLLKIGGENFNIITEALPFYSEPSVLNGIALGYQLGFLILPAIIPISYWVLRHQLFLKQISKT